MTTDIRKIAEKTFAAHLVSDTSYSRTELGKLESTMTLYATDIPGHAFIEWDIPALEQTEEIGLNFDVQRNLLDYDGVFSLPREAIALLRANGFKVGKDFAYTPVKKAQS